MAKRSIKDQIAFERASKNKTFLVFHSGLNTPLRVRAPDINKARNEIRVRKLRSGERIDRVIEDTPGPVPKKIRPLTKSQKIKILADDFKFKFNLSPAKSRKAAQIMLDTKPEAANRFIEKTQRKRSVGAFTR